MEYKDIMLQKEGGIATITLNRPEKLNALSPAMHKELPQAIEEVVSDDSVRVLILTGAGRGFCSGADVSMQAARIAGELEAKSRREIVAPLGGFIASLAKMDKLAIAAVNGVAYGAGLSLALACDIRIASENARFSVGYVKRALVPDGGTTYFLPRIVGISKAMELMCTGDIIDAKEAERIGLVTKVVPAEELMKSVKELASKIANGPPIAIELTKGLAHKGLENDLDSQLYLESYAQKICWGTEDHKESVKAFFEKREPIYRGA